MARIPRLRALALATSIAACLAIPATAGAATLVAARRHPTVRGGRGGISEGRGYARWRAPVVARQFFCRANEIRHKPYKWGGGHGTWYDSGYDCSGAVSYALHGGGLLDSPLDSRGFMRWGSSGPGRWITVYARDGHAWMVVAGLQFNTSGAGEHGPRWRPEAPRTAGFVARHPAGL